MAGVLGKILNWLLPVKELFVKEHEKRKLLLSSHRRQLLCNAGGLKISLPPKKDTGNFRNFAAYVGERKFYLSY